MIEIKTKLFEFNEEYDLVIFENHPEEIYHYVMLKAKRVYYGEECNDCFICQKARKTKKKRVSGHKGYPINITNYHGFDLDYLKEKLDINEVEVALLGKILMNHYGVKIKKFFVDIE